MSQREREQEEGGGEEEYLPPAIRPASLGDSAKSTAGPCVMSQPQQPVTRAEAGRRCTQPPLKLSHTKRGSSLAALLQDGGGRREGGGQRGEERAVRDTGWEEERAEEWKHKRQRRRGGTQREGGRGGRVRGQLGAQRAGGETVGGAAAADRPSCSLGHRPIKAGTPILTHQQQNHHHAAPAKTSRRSRQTQIKGRASAAARPPRCPPAASALLQDFTGRNGRLRVSVSSHVLGKD